MPNEWRWKNTIGCALFRRSACRPEALQLLPPPSHRVRVERVQASEEEEDTGGHVKRVERDEGELNAADEEVAVVRVHRQVPEVIPPGRRGETEGMGRESLSASARLSEH